MSVLRMVRSVRLIKGAKDQVVPAYDANFVHINLYLKQQSI